MKVVFSHRKIIPSSFDSTKPLRWAGFGLAVMMNEGGMAQIQGKTLGHDVRWDDLGREDLKKEHISERGEHGEVKWKERI